MKNSQPLFLYLTIATLAVFCGLFAVHAHRLEHRVTQLEQQVAHSFDPKVVKIAVVH